MGRIDNPGPSRKNNGQQQPQFQAAFDIQVQPQACQYDQDVPHEATAATEGDDTDSTSWLVHETYHEEYQQEPELAHSLETVELEPQEDEGEEEQVQQPQTQKAEQNAPPPRSNQARPKPVQFPPQSPQAYPPQRPQRSDIPDQFPPVHYPPQSQQEYPAQMPPVINPTQVVPQPAISPQVPPQVIPVPTRHWSSGLFDCMNDPTNALVTIFFPCLTFGQIAEIVDNGQTSCQSSGMFYGFFTLIWLPCLMSTTYRTKLRSKYGLMEDSGPDCMTHFFCECCALCQEYRELQSRGFDPSIGWVANMQKQQQQQQQIAMVPPANNRMMH